MAITCGNDMSVVVKGYQIDLIKQILENRDYVLAKFNIDETLTPDKKRLARGSIGSSIRNFFCGIREEGTLERRNQSDFLLELGQSRREPGMEQNPSWHESYSKNVSYELSTPSVDEFLDFMRGKELVFETKYFDHGGGYEEDLVNAFCKNVLLLKRKEDNYLSDDSYQVNIFLQKVTDSEINMPNSLTPVPVNDFVIYEQIMKSLEKIVWDHAGFDNSDLVLNFETRDANLNAGYFIARYHSNPAWDMKPVNILRLRIAVFLLPGGLSMEDSQNLPGEKLTTDKTGNLYKLDSIHFYSDICFTLEEFKKLVDWHLGIIDLA